MTHEIDERALHNACSDMGIDKNNPNYRMFLEYYVAALPPAPKQRVKVEECAIKTLAEYFTGTLVAKYSIDLQIASRHDEAMAFFKARKALGIDGYATFEEATKILGAL
jgi:hypothetical protein